MLHDSKLDKFEKIYKKNVIQTSMENKFKKREEK